MRRTKLKWLYANREHWSVLKLVRFVPFQKTQIKVIHFLTMGIDRELIVSEFGKEHCACNICTQLVEDAIVLKCEHFYCKNASTRKLRKRKRQRKKWNVPNANSSLIQGRT